MAITFGSEYIFNSADTSVNVTCVLDENNFIVAYQDKGNAYYGTLRLATRTGTSISYGSEIIFNSANTSAIKLTALDSTHFIVAYYDGKVKLGTISGSSITFGNVADFGSSYYYDIDTLTNSTFIVSYRTTSNGGFSVIGTVTGTDINFGTAYNWSTNSLIFVDVAMTDSTHFTIIYRDQTNTKTRGISATISSGVISYGSPVDLYSAVPTLVRVAKLSSSKVVFSFNIVNSVYNIIGEISGNTLTVGSDYEASTDSNISDVTAMSEDVFIVLLNEDSSPYRLWVRQGTVTGTTISYGTLATVHSAWAYESENNQINIASLNKYEFELTYCDYMNSEYGTNTIGSLPIPETFSFTGNSSESGSASFISKIYSFSMSGDNSDFGTLNINKNTNFNLIETNFTSSGSIDYQQSLMFDIIGNNSELGEIDFNKSIYFDIIGNNIDSGEVDLRKIMVLELEGNSSESGFILFESWEGNEINNNSKVKTFIGGDSKIIISTSNSSSMITTSIYNNSKIK